MLTVRNTLIVAVRPRQEDGTENLELVRLCMSAKDGKGMPIWEMSNEAAASLRDQLNEVLGEA